MNIDKALRIAHEHFQNKNYHQSEHICNKIIEKKPNHIKALNLLGIISLQLGEYHVAMTHLKKAIRLNPRNAEAYYHLGVTFHDTGQLDEAITYYRKALRINPAFIPACYNLGVALQNKGYLDEALRYYQKALELNPNFAEVYNNLGTVLKDKGHLDEALLHYQKACELNPNISSVYNNLGVVYQYNGHLDEAAAYYQKALDLNPELFDVLNNLGLVWREKGEIDKAITFFQKSLQINPTYADAHWNLSYAYLLTGNFREGWKEYEWRLKTDEFISRQRNFPQPLWDGTMETGRTILLCAEQGYGDAIQFIRYAPLVSARGLQVIVECQNELALFLRNTEGISQVFIEGESLPGFDVYCPLLSLPFIFDTTPETIPVTIPYVSADLTLIKKWEAKIQSENSRIKIGLVWSGNPKYTKDRNRSFSLGLFSPFAEFTDVAFYSLQKGEAATQAKNPLEGIKLIDFTEDIHDFSDTAAFIENLDLIISVDTAVAHLAGALGKPVWTLLPFVPDWRWMLNREDSPWYPTMRLFRQPSPGDWESVIARLAQELTALKRGPHHVI